MSVLVIDASVAAKTCVVENHSDRAIALLTSGITYVAPDLIWVELASVLSTYYSRSVISASEVLELFNEALGLPLRIHASRSLLPTALAISMRLNRSVYDALYVALAIQEQCELITADEKLVRALSQSEFAHHVRSLADM